MPIRPAQALVAALALLLAVAAAPAQEPWRFILPEQRQMQIRDPSQLAPIRLPDVPTPRTVTQPHGDDPLWRLSLDEAIRTALANAEAIRVLAGATAVSSGQTIYDPAIANTVIDQARGRFDPVVTVPNDFFRTETPQAVLIPSPIPGNPPTVQIIGPTTNTFITAPTISKTTITGGSLNYSFEANASRFGASGFPLNPQTGTASTFSVTQPLLQGAGPRVNLAPIVIARIDTERSFFLFKDSVQELVRGVIQAYWGLLFARTDVWARRQQVEQGEEAFRRAEGRLRAGLGNSAEVAQSRASMQMFRANLIGSEANLLQQEAVLRNLLGLSPSDHRRIIPISQASTERLQSDWEEIRELASEYRPDLIELKLILEADDQRLLIARNNALPKLDLLALYRWNGLDGRTPDLQPLTTGPGQFTDWQFGVNFSVPLGLRQPRAAMRQQELLIARDRANLTQGLHNASHGLAANYRNMAQYYDQYLAYRDTREAAQINLDRQLADFRTGRRTLYVNVLQAITDWGNAVSLEAQALTSYNTELANLERQTGTILETHGVRFYEERYRSIGPLGRLFRPRAYPQSERPTPNADQYPIAPQSEINRWEITTPLPKTGRELGDRLPPPDKLPPTEELPPVEPDAPPRPPVPLRIDPR